jgi:nicotinamidase/pyrazinamidase
MELSERDCLLVVDVQNDFCTGGALAVDDGDEVVPVINDWIRRAVAAGTPVVASRDWHPADHKSFAENGGPWPVHCVRGTTGAEFHSELDLPAGAVVVSKATAPERESYSAFDGTDLAETLRDRNVNRLLVGGLALDYCVKATAVDAVAAGFEVHLLRDATRAVDARPGDGRRALDELRRAGVKIDEVER